MKRWLTVLAVVLTVLVVAMGLRHTLRGTNPTKGSVVVANGFGPVPPPPPWKR